MSAGDLLTAAEWMTAADWAFVKRLAVTSRVTLRAAGVKRSQRLGYAIDSIIATAETSR
jgi:hypothetical protein